MQTDEGNRLGKILSSRFGFCYYFLYAGSQFVFVGTVHPSLIRPALPVEHDAQRLQGTSAIVVLNLF